MSHHKPSDVLRECMQAPGARFTEDALLIDAGATEEQLAIIGRLAAQAEHSRAWWIGDWGVALQKRVGYRYATGRAEALDIEPSTFVIYKGVAEFFQPEKRIKGLNFFHHREAMHAAHSAKGQKRAAFQWLTKAQEEKWTVPQLRMAIRADGAEFKADGKKPSGNDYFALLNAERWAMLESKELAAYTPERATAVLSDVPNLLKLLLQLQAMVDRTRASL